MMILFDSHCHIDDPCYDRDLDSVFERAQSEGVCCVMIVGIDGKTSHRAVEIAGNYDHVVTSVGIHPHDAQKCTQDRLKALIEMAQTHDCIKAWGETGLDFNRMFSPAKDQEACFIRQMEIAGELNLPLICHERDSEGRFYKLLKAHGPAARNGVVHCFSGTKQEMFKYLDLGYHIGITGIVTIKKRGEYLRSLVPHIPEDRILIETDAPYLTPAPEKNKVRRNEPAFVKSVLLKLAEIKKADPEELSRIIFDNTCRLYRVNFSLT